MDVKTETAGGRFHTSPPAKVIAGGRYTVGLTGDYDISPDGSRFLMIKNDDSTPTVTPAIVVVQNFVQELKRLLPPR